MSNGTPTVPTQQLPLTLYVAPYPEGFKGDMDQTMQQFCALVTAYVQGNFLTGLVLPPGSTLPTSDVGPILMGGVWYYWDSTTGQYLPQTSNVKPAKNFCKNPVYQIQQVSGLSTIPAGITYGYDLSLVRSTNAGILSISADVGPTASADTDTCSSAVKYTVGTTLVPTLGASDLYAHEHLIEGCDLAPLQGQVLSLGLSVWVNQPGTYSVYLTSSGRDCSYVANFTVATANTWSRIKVPAIPAIPTSGTWHYGEGQTGMYIGVVMAVGTQWQVVSANLNTWQNAFVAGSAQNINMLTVTNNQIKISAIKLEASPTCTYTTTPSFEEDFWQALRYYYSSFNYQSVTAGIPLQIRCPYNTAWSAVQIFRQRMAVAPKVVPYGYQTHAAGNITNVRGGTAVDIPVATMQATREGISDLEVIALTNTSTQTGTVTAIAITGNTTTGSSQIANVTPAEAQSVLPGATITGAGIPANATVLSYNSGGQILNISVAATATANNVTFNVGSPTVTALSSTSALQPGMSVTGTGVPSGCTITSIVSTTSIQLSEPVAPGTGISFTFGTSPLIAGDPLLAYVIADARLS